MSTTTLSFPLDSMPGLPVEEGSEFLVKVRNGKLQVTLPETEKAGPAVAEDLEDPAVRFVRKWSGAFKYPEREELDADPRLAYLVEKHLK